METIKEMLPEMTLKYKKHETLHKTKLSVQIDVFDYLCQLYDDDTISLREYFIVLFLDNCNQTVGWTMAGMGGINEVTVDHRLLMATALTSGATKMIISHNHPSGGISPSKHDLSITKRLRDCCNLFGIKLVDHIIINDDKTLYYSFAAEGDIL